MLKRFFSGVLTLALLLAPVTLLWQRQNIQDWWTLRNYIPTTEISQVASDTTMTDYGKRIFYLSKPLLEDKSTFQKSCTSTEKTIVLGCYKNNEGIFVYNVTDERLSGVIQVTSAHEMLHAAYERLSTAERKHIDTLTQDAYNSITDERIKKNVELYRERDASVVPNELHSILGTEVAKLSPELEQHYSLYFKDRQKIIQYSTQYESEFTSRENQVEAYQAQRTAIKAQYDSLKSVITEELAAIESESARIDQLEAAGKIAERNAAVPNYNKMVSKYKSDVSKLNSLADQDKVLYDLQSALATEEQQLLQAIDTRLPSAR